MNSVARWPWVTLTPPMRRLNSGPKGLASITFIHRPFRSLSRRCTFAQIAMYGVRIETGAPQTRGQFTSNHHRSMTPARAANSDREIRLTFKLILRQKILKKIVESVQSFFDLGLIL